MMHLAVYQVLKEQRKNKVSLRIEQCRLRAGENFEHFLIENRGYYVELSDPDVIQGLLEELDDAEMVSRYLDEWGDQGHDLL